MAGAGVAPDVLAALREIDSPTVSNGVEFFKVRDRTAGYASLELRCLTPGQQPMVGYAVTVTADSTTPAETRPERIHDVFDMIHSAPQPAVLVIQHVGTDRLKSCFVGDMFCTGLSKYGATGVVTDGGVRDVPGIRQRAPGFSVFAAGTVVSHGTPVFLDFNTTVSICGLTIRPGDLLHGDDSGLLTIPLEIAEPLVEQARAVQARERAYFDFLASSEFSHEGIKKHLGRVGH
jgi:regulator of RNase E activity RraA